MTRDLTSIADFASLLSERVGRHPPLRGEVKRHACAARPPDCLALAALGSACQFAGMVEPAKPKAAAPDTPSRDDRYALREGEVAVALPEKFDASLYYIGRIRTPWRRREDCPKNARQSDAVCTVELDPRWAKGLTGLDGVSHVLLLYWMDKARRDLVLQSPRHYAERRGTFALRSPVRPNPIAASVARLAARRRQQAHGRRPRLPRRHAAPRHQALFRLDRFRARRAGRVA